MKKNFTLVMLTGMLLISIFSVAQTTYILTGGSLSGTLAPWDGIAYFYTPKFNVNATNGIDITYYDIDVSLITHNNFEAWGDPVIKGWAEPGISTNTTMGGCDPLNNSVWINLLNMNRSSGVDWYGNAISTIGPDGIANTDDDTRHQGTQDWYRPSTGGKVDGVSNCPYYNTESYVIPNPRFPTATPTAASELNKYDLRLRVLPIGGNQYTYEMWVRKHTSAAQIEGAYWVYNKAMNTVTDAWIAFPLNADGSGATVFTISNIDLSAVHVFMGLGNWYTEATHAITWGQIQVTGTYAAPSEVWVDDNYTSGGMNDGHWWGYDAFATVQDGVNAVATGGTVNVAAGTYTEGSPQVAISKNLSIVGADKLTTIIKPSASTTSCASNDDNSGWFLVNSGYAVNFSNLTFDGTSFTIGQGIRMKGPGVIDNCIFKDIKCSTYYGLAISIWDANATVSNCNFSNIGRVGIHVNGSLTTNAIVTGNTYVGKGVGDWLDYGVEVERGAKATITYNNVSDCLGVASDGSTSAGMYATTYFNPGTQATINDNTFSNNSDAIAVGYDASDAAIVTAYHNSFLGTGTTNGVTSTSSTITVDAEENYWGSILLTDVDNKASGLVDFDPWCNADFTICNYTEATSNGPITYAGKVVAPIGSVTVPITVTSFSNVTAISLIMHYNPAILTFTGFTPNSALGGLGANGSNGTVAIGWFGDAPGVSLADNDYIVNLNFNFIGGTSPLTWDDSNDGNCEYANEFLQPYIDDPTAYYYIDGWVTDLSVSFTRAYSPSPGTITAVPAGGTSPYSYAWTGPSGFIAGNTATITPTNGYGNYVVTVTDDLGATTTGTYYYGPVHNIDTYIDYALLNDAIDAAATLDGHTIAMDPGTYVEIGQIVVDKNLTIIGDSKTTTIIKPNAHHASTSNGWMYVAAGKTLNLSKVQLDGSGYNISNAIYQAGNGVINDCQFTQIMNPWSNPPVGPIYDGTAIRVVSTANIDITNCDFTQIGRNGIRAQHCTGTVSGNAYTGKGAGDWMDYFILAEYGCNILINGNTVTNCIGIALVDGSGSAAIAVWDDINTTAVITNNILTGNSTGIGIAGINSATLPWPWPAVTIGAGNVITGGEFGITMDVYSGYTCNPPVTFGTTTITGQTVAAISIGDAVSPGTNYDISSITLSTTDNCSKEDLVIHAIDAGNRALLVWNPNNVYVTVNSFVAPETAPSIQRGIDAVGATGWTVNVCPGTYGITSQILVNKSVDIVGDVANRPVVQALNDLNGGTAGSYIFRIDNAVNANVDISNLVLDGNEFNVYGGMRYNSNHSGVVNNCRFQNIVAPGYSGFGIVDYGTMTITNNVFTNIGRVGMWIGGTDNTVSYNTYTGKGTLDCLDYGIEVGFGGDADITFNTITNCSGTASDGSTSAGIMATTYYGPGTTAVIENNVITGNTEGIVVGYDETDVSTVTVHNNDISGNTNYGIISTAPIVNATCNWWGTADGDLVRAETSGSVTYSPWLVSGTNEVPAGPGFYQASPICTGTPVVASAVPTPVYCGPTPGSILVIWTGGTPNYTVSWTGTSSSSAPGLASSPYTIAGLTAGSYTVTVTDANGSSSTVDPVVVQYLPVHNVTQNTYHATIQDAIDATSTVNGDVINICAGTYVENVVVSKEVTLNGAGMGSTIVIPALSAPNPCNNSSLCDGAASNVFLVQANNVTIQNLTVDGDNTALTSGAQSNGVDVDARNGIITNSLAGSYNGLNVNHVTVKNIYLRGINISYGTGFNVHDNLVTNVEGDSYNSIALFTYGGTGAFTGNTVSYTPAAIASNHSKGTSYTGNVITHVGTGIHSDNNGDSGGSPDLIQGNTISDGNTNAYGIFIFAPYLNVQVLNNNVSNYYVGFASAGQYTTVNPLVSGNTFTAGTTGLVGIYTTSEVWGYAEGNQNITLTNNFINNFPYSFDVEAATAGKTNTTVATNNSITGSTSLVYTSGSTATADMTCNWWGTADGDLIAPKIGSNVTFSPWLVNGTDIEGAIPGFQPVPGSCDGSPVVIDSALPDDILCGETSGSITVSFSGGVAPIGITWTGTASGSAFDIENPYTIPSLGVGSYDITLTDANGSSASAGPLNIQYLPVHNMTQNTYHATIQGAIDAITTVNDDVIEVCNGTYIASNILVNKSVTIQGQSRVGVIIAPAAEDANVDNAFGSSAQNGFIIAANGVTIKDLTLDGTANPALTPGKYNFRTGIVTLDASQPGGGAWNNLHVDNVHVKNIYRRGISVYYDATSHLSYGNLIENSTIENITFNDAIRIYGNGEVRYCEVKNAFQGILFYLNTTTPAGICKINNNTISGIGNHPGCWGYNPGPPVTYDGQPRAIQYNNADGAGRQVEIKNNIISDNGLEEFSGTVGIYTRLANAASVVEENQITLTSGVSWSQPGSQNVGLLLGWSYDNGFLAKNNVVNSTKYGIGVMIHDCGTSTNPLILEGNTLTSTNSARESGGDGDGAGIYISNEYLFYPADQGASYAIIRNDNEINGYVKGIEVVKSPTATQAITLQVLDNDGSITGNEIGIDASYGDITINGNDIYSNGTGIKLSGTANLISATNNFIRNNTSDGILVAADALGTYANITGNSITNNGVYSFENLSSSSLNATCNWWGTTDGDVIATEISGTVTYSPWLVGDTDIDDPGFVPGDPCTGSLVDITSAVPDHITYGETTGSIEVVFTGGTANYVVDWGSSSATGIAGSPYTITGLPAGTYTITVTDVNGSSDTYGPVTIYYYPVTNVTDDPDAGYSTIQEAIDAAATDPGDVIRVDAGTFSGNVNITKGISLLGANAGIACTGTRGAESIISGSGGAAVTVSADGVTIDGFEITNPSGNYAISASGRSNLLVQNNVITEIGTSGSPGYVHAIAVVMSSTTAINNVRILDNCISNINNTGNNGSGSGIGVGWSNAAYDITNLIIQRNTISDVNSNPNSTGGKGAYGIIINVGSSSSASGKAVSPDISYNSIYDLEGLWAHAIGLEGETPGASVKNNWIDHIIDHKSPTDAVGVQIEDNDGAATVSINDNSFTSVKLGIQNVTTIPVTNASCNWYGTADGDLIAGMISGTVTYWPWLVVGTDNNGTAPGFVPTSGVCTGSPVTITETHVNVTCNGGNDGSIDITVSGGVSPLTYLWSPGGQTTEDLTGLIAGTYTVTVTDANTSTGTITVTITEPAVISISGVLTYHNTANTPMNNVTIQLKQGASVIYTTTTLTNGSYSFSPVCPGTYDVVFTTVKPVGGINSTDAGLVNGWNVNQSGGIHPTIERVQFNAGDVTGDNSILSNDAQSIQIYFITLGATPFVPAWEFWKAGETVNAQNPAPTSLQITVTQASPPVILNFYGMVSGDFNQSFTPGAARSVSNTLTLVDGQTIQAGPDMVIDLPVRIESGMEVGAISLIMNFPSDKLSVENVYLQDDPMLPIMYNVIDSELRIGWNSLTPLLLATGETMLTVKVKTAATLENGEILHFNLSSDPLNELADGAFNVIPEAVLAMDVIECTLVGINDPTKAGDLVLGSYPNPFNGITNIVYTIPEEGYINLEITGLLGDRLALMTDQRQMAGRHLLSFDGKTLPPGIYLVSLRLKSQSGDYMKTIRIVSQ